MEFYLTSVLDKKFNERNAVILTAQRLKNAPNARLFAAFKVIEAFLHRFAAMCAVKMTVFRSYPKLTLFM
jgi:hypothetical protein